MARVVLFGSSNTDMTVRLPGLPAPGQTILGSTFCTTPGGKGANQAVAARRAGGDVVLVAAVGDDLLGKQSLELYRREGIDVRHVRVITGASSGVALIFVGGDGENMIGVAPGANGLLGPDDVDALPASLFRPDDVLVAGLEIPLTTAIRAMQRGAAGGMQVILNPAPVPPLSRPEVIDLLSNADVVIPNRGEALALAGLDSSSAAEPEWLRCAGRLLEAGAGAVVITLGARGCCVADGTETRWLAAPRVEVVDTVGAGDAFTGALAVALAEKRSLAAAAAWASAAGALAVTVPGAQPALPRRDAIDRLAARARTESFEIR
jgi:ribokinase